MAAGMNQRTGSPRITPQPPTATQRWRSPLLLVTLGGLLFALLSGAALLFIPMPPVRRDYWVIAHWIGALATIAPYALFQLRHYARVRPFFMRAPYRVGVHAFFMICGTLLTGLPLVTPLVAGTRTYAIVDLAHIFFGFVFVLLVSAHLALVGAYTLAQEPDAARARSAVRHALIGMSLIALALLYATIRSS